MLFRSAKQAISVEVDQRISVIDALRAAEARTIDGQVTEVIEQQAPTQLARVVKNVNEAAA